MNTNARPSCLRLAIALAGLTTAAIGHAAARDRPPTLAGERFVDQTTPTLVVNAVCNPAGTSTITFNASGPVTEGPYQGQFAESGTIVIGPQNGPPNSDGIPTGPVTSFSASFAIDAGSTEVSGSKNWTPTRRATAGAVCNDNASAMVLGEPSTGRVVEVSLGMFPNSMASAPDYDASIQAPGGTFSDSGTAQVRLEDTYFTGTQTGSGYARFVFAETFTSKQKSTR